MRASRKVNWKWFQFGMQRPLDIGFFPCKVLDTYFQPEQLRVLYFDTWLSLGLTPVNFSHSLIYLFSYIYINIFSYFCSYLCSVLCCFLHLWNVKLKNTARIANIWEFWAWAQLFPTSPDRLKYNYHIPLLAWNHEDPLPWFCPHPTFFAPGPHLYTSTPLWPLPGSYLGTRPVPRIQPARGSGVKDLRFPAAVAEGCF